MVFSSSILVEIEKLSEYVSKTTIASCPGSWQVRVPIQLASEQPKGKYRHPKKLKVLVRDLLLPFSTYESISRYPIDTNNQSSKFNFAWYYLRSSTVIWVQCSVHSKWDIILCIR